MPIFQSKQGDKIGARARLSANQSIANTTWTKLTLATEDYDLGANFDAATNYWFTVPYAGIYVITAGVYFASVADGVLLAGAIIINNTTFAAEFYGRTGGTGAQIVSIAMIDQFAANDTIQLKVYQGTGGALDITADEGTFLAVHLLSRTQ